MEFRMIRIFALLISLFALSGCGNDNSKNRSEGPKITGTISFEEAVDPSEFTRIEVSLSDTSIADMAEIRISQVVLENFNELPINFSLPYDGDLISDRNSYNISVSVYEDDIESNEIRSYLTTQSYPVLTHGFNNEAHVTVENIK